MRSWSRLPRRCAECSASQVAPTTALYLGCATLAVGAAFFYLCMRFRNHRASTAGERDSLGGVLDELLPRCLQRLLQMRRAAMMLSLLRRRARWLGTLGKVLLAYFQVLNTFSQLNSIRWPTDFSAYLEARRYGARSRA